MICSAIILPPKFIFLSFYRGFDTYMKSRKSKGQGIGMTICCDYEGEKIRIYV